MEEFMLKLLYPEKSSRGYKACFIEKSIREKLIDIPLGTSILVMYNIELCHDLFKNGHENVTFISDDKTKGDIVKEAYGFSIEEKPKYDTLIGHLPHAVNKDIKILNEFLPKVKTAKVIMVTRQLRHETFDRIEKIEIINEMLAFTYFPYCICSFTEHAQDTYTVFNKSVMINAPAEYKIKSGEVLSYCDQTHLNSVLSKISDRIEPHLQWGVQSSRKCNFQLRNKTNILDGKFINDSRKRGVRLMESFEKCWNNPKTFWGSSVNFPSENHAKNFYNFLHTNLARFCESIFEEKRNIPWLDFSREWTNDDACLFFGLTEEEKAWIDNQIALHF